MARQRIIKPDFFTDEDLARCSPHARLLFAGLWTLADKRGRLRDQPEVICGAIFPYEPSLDVGALLEVLASSDLIQRYEVDEKHFIWIPNFEKHQRPHPKEAESVIPAAVKLHGRAVKRLASKSSLPVGTESFPSESIPSGGTGTGAPGEPVENPTDPPARSHSEAGTDDDRGPMTESTAGQIEAVAKDLALAIPGVTAEEWVTRASRIEASNGKSERSFVSPRRRGISEGWGRVTLRELLAMREEAKRPVPL